ncbi:hypothetical protein CFC21_075804 [Triticum aestivum]|uniref:Uncharacterized protein n=2 Tax=Triticum aestivum TaxID=4565 RepID=A0A3B6MLP5_WHEAT|nr:hypothetical protein CFC21_075804 [Triticum aestivum]
MSPAKTDAFLVAKDPLFLCVKVEKTLAPVVAGLTDLCLSRSEITCLVSLPCGRFRCRSIVSRLHYYLPVFGSSENLLRALKGNFYLFSSDLDGVVKPKVMFLRDCGLGACDIAKLCSNQPGLLTTNLERCQGPVACAKKIGVPRGSGMFRHALNAVASRGGKKIAARVEHLKCTFTWSDAELRIDVSRFPLMLTRSKESLQRRSEFLISEVGLEAAYIAHRPVMLGLSLEGRLRPRYYAVMFLKENGLLKRDRDFFSTVVVSEKVFMERFICPHKKAAPHLAKDYATGCRGEVSARFSFT